jgi:hypothetical protein
MQKREEVRGRGGKGQPPLPLPTPNTLPGEACQCLYCYLICKNGKILCSTSGSSTGSRKEAYKYRREKNIEEKFVLGEIQTAPQRKISIKWSCRTTSIIHTHSRGQARTQTQRKREICKSFLIYSII